MLCLIAGIPLVSLPRFSATTFWQSAKDNGVTIFYLLGTKPMFLLKQPKNPALERGHKLRIVLCSDTHLAVNAALLLSFLDGRVACYNALVRNE
ncbi:MAG TPA: hypothetical protein VH540_18160 [Ktedonobacterales bacterium]